MNYIKGAWVDKSPSEKADAEARLDGIEAYFKGDLKELKRIISYQPKNKVKALFGVKTTSEGKEYQTVYTQMFLRNNSSTDYSKLAKEIQDRRDNGAFADTEFQMCEIKEHTIEATNFSTSTDVAGDVDPFAAASPWSK